MEEIREQFEKSKREDNGVPRKLRRTEGKVQVVGGRVWENEGYGF